MDISVITVNTNDKERIIAQIASVKNGAVGLNFEQIISDNGSSDGSVAEIKSKFSEVKIILNNKNIGFGGANNVAAKISSGRYLLFLNPDMRVAPDSLKTLITWADKHPRLGIASCKLVKETGEFNPDTSPRRFPKLFDQIIILLKLSHLFPSLLNKYLYHDLNHDSEQAVDSVRGSFMLMRRELFDKLGFAFDPRYFIWFEDVDTCREAKRLGYEVIYTPIISCVDYVGQSFKKLPSLQKQKWFTASMVKYFQKWEPWYKWMVILTIKPLGILLVLIASKLNKHYAKIND
ncbi:MAG: hypothetical protein A3J93_00950 [Candidatus Magasanikbacteria bacterium RIFOXYC2_FULL_42_28]|uniref:Glycosyltransferase 2-like domain-containing protein n=1 Tax=Candidatus Magasanikbacteria bacterium RIFOXYC2_FULL_42_28 TaxID=1798704 RepID=A0A1F6NXJ2_9BACT|nr:MAG: hypothetical protein A3J93_00950 [Candidatus Magasanikbacteria bacterium RIFOXYC2_FULL_42_28]